MPLKLRLLSLMTKESMSISPNDEQFLEKISGFLKVNCLLKTILKRLIFGAFLL